MRTSLNFMKLWLQNVTNYKIIVFIAHEQNKNRGSVYLVFEYVEHDFHGIVDR